jgi:hypothetical protein
MSRFAWRFLPGMAVVCGLLAAEARAETCKLALKRLPPRGEVFSPGLLTIEPPAAQDPCVEHVWRAMSPQSFFMQIMAKGTKNPQEAEFQKIVRKEPKYNSPQPLRGVVTLGSDKYCFALDAKDEKVGGYNRLYFDLKHSGNLSDQKPIDPAAGDEKGQAGPRIIGSANVAQFPRVDLVVNAGGTKVDYSFYFQVYWQDAGPFKYASASLTAAVYREGEITLDGKKHHLILVDANSNGRFDDPITPVETVGAAGGAIYHTPGDVLLVDPERKDLEFVGYSRSLPCDHPVSKLLAIDGRFYDAKFTAAGDSLTLTPCTAPLGRVTSPHEGLQALLYGDLGVLRITCDRSQPLVLPAGKWRLLEYTIDRTGWQPPPPPAAKEKAKPVESSKVEHSLLEALVQALTGLGGSAEAGPAMRNGPTMVAAAATMACPAIQVRAGQTVTLPFGPPFKPVVTAFPMDGKTARLQLSLVGAAGEACNNLLVQGGRPPKPQFTIKTPKGDVVQSGSFEYG